MAIQPLSPEPIIPRNPKPRLSSLPEVTDEGKIAHAVKGIPSPSEMKKLAAAVAAMAATEIILGKHPFRNASEAAKVARDFASIAKDFEYDDEREIIASAETKEDRIEGLKAFKAKALEALESGD